MEIQLLEKRDIKKNVLNILKYHDLQVRDLVISKDGKYLISCSESWENEKPKVFLWNISKLLEGDNEPEVILEGDFKQNRFTKITNWLLCIDSAIIEINNTKWWVVCAGNIIEDIYIWYGKVDNASLDWIFDDFNFTIFSENKDPNVYPKAIFNIKILKDPLQSNSCHIYITSNNIHTVGLTPTKDNTLKEIIINLNSSGQIEKPQSSQILGIQDEWITDLDLHINEIDAKKNIIVIGTRDGAIYKWNLGSGIKVNPILIGKHKDSITSVKVFNDGSKIASSSIDNKIRIWYNNDNNNPNLVDELIGHSDSILSIDIQKDDKTLISVSKDNTAKMWALDKGNWIRNVDITRLIDEYEKDVKVLEKGMFFLNHIKVSPDNRYIFITKYNKIIILRNFGPIWHLTEQMKFTKNNDIHLYQKIYGENLTQMAITSPENTDALKDLYEVIKKRLIKATEIELAQKTRVSDHISDKYRMRELATLFIPSFIEFETNSRSQKEYILGVKENYEAYWFSIKNLFFKLPEIPWNFRLFITTDMEEDIKEAKFVEITDPKFKDSAYIIMKDRSQTQVRILMTLNNVPTSFIPLINSINVDLEDDRGDKDSLVFSDFTFSKNFINKLTNSKKSLKKSTRLSMPKNVFYSYCTFQLDDGYATENFANIFIRKLSVEFTETLNPTELSISEEDDIKIYEAFKNNFQYPLLPKIQIQIGKGIASAVGKIIDDYFAKIIIIEFIFSFWGFIEIGIPVLIGYEFPSWVSNIVSVAGIVIIIVIFLTMLINMRSKKMGVIDKDELDAKLRKRRRRQYRE